MSKIASPIAGINIEQDHNERCQVAFYGPSLDKSLEFIPELQLIALGHADPAPLHHTIC